MLIQLQVACAQTILLFVLKGKVSGALQFRMGVSTIKYAKVGLLVLCVSVVSKMHYKYIRLLSLTYVWLHFIKNTCCSCNMYCLIQTYMW